MNESGLKLIKNYLEDSKIVLVDVGARGGINKRWKSIAPILKVIGFEPDEKECEQVNLNAKSSPNELVCYPFALGQHKNTKVKLNICKDPGCISIYEPNTEFVDSFYYAPNMQVTKTIDITLNTLNDVCEQNHIKPDCIKIDTQGYELEILKGSLNILNQVKFLELEVEFNPQYKNQPLFSDIDLFLREKGFLLLGIRRTYWRRQVNDDLPKSHFGGQIMHGDAIYYNARHLDNEAFASVKELIKYCTILSLYKQDDFISHIFGSTKGVLANLSQDKRKELVEALLNKKPIASLAFSKLLGIIRKKLWLPHRELRRKLDSLQSENAVDWHDPDFF